MNVEIPDDVFHRLIQRHAEPVSNRWYWDCVAHSEGQTCCADELMPYLLKAAPDGAA